MKDLFPKFFEDNWLFKVLYNKKGVDLFAKILLTTNLFTVLNINPGTTIALYATNSFNWVAIYLAAIVRGVTLLIIPPKMDLTEIVHILSFSNTQYIFLDPNLFDWKLRKLLPMKSMFDINTLQVVHEKSPELNIADITEIVIDSHVTSSPTQYSYDYYRDAISLSNVKHAKVITPTSGTTHAIPKWVISTWPEIKSMLFATRSALPFDESSNIAIYVDFAETHYITVLSTLLNGCHVTDEISKAHTVVEDTASIERLWREINVELFNNRFKAFIYSTKVFAWLFNWNAANRLKRAYSRTVENIIIYNSDVSNHIIDLLRRNFKVYSTYGLQEACQLLAVNDYSTKELLDEHAVGRLLKGVDVYTNNVSEIQVSSYQNCNRYLRPGEDLNKLYFRSDILNTGDVGTFNIRSGVLYVYGKSITTKENEYGLPFHINNLERTLRIIPYIKAACIYTKDKNSIVLLVEPNVDFLDVRNIKLATLKTILESYLRGINKMLREVYHIDEVRIMSKPLEKTFNGKLVRYYYN